MQETVFTSRSTSGIYDTAFTSRGTSGIYDTAFTSRGTSGIYDTDTLLLSSNLEIKLLSNFP